MTTKPHIRRWTCPPKWEWADYLAAVAAADAPDDVPLGEPAGRPHLPACVPDTDWDAFQEFIAADRKGKAA